MLAKAYCAARVSTIVNQSGHFLFYHGFDHIIKRRPDVLQDVPWHIAVAPIYKSQRGCLRLKRAGHFLKGATHFLGKVRAAMK